MDIQSPTVQKCSLIHDSCGNTHELRSQSHGHFSATCQSVGTESGHFREGWVAKPCLIEKRGLYMYGKHGAGALSRICAGPTIVKTR